MYENVTYESILQRMLNRIPNTFDKREGSVIYDALAPAAVELQNMYLELDNVLNESFADTASRPYLIKRCAERNIKPQSATHAIRQGEFNIDVSIGSRFSLNKLNYVVTEKISDGIFKMQCETAGNVGNIESGTLIPIEYVDGLQTAVLTDVLIHGDDEEETEKLRDRYFDSYNSYSFGGNVADYREKTKTISEDKIGGVGGVKVKRAWNGGGTVKLVIIDSTYSKPSDALVEYVQEKTDPLEHQGEGLGFAPIDHIVTVVGCGETPVNIQTTFSFEEGWEWDDVKTNVFNTIDAYFKELSETWEDAEESSLIVRISQIETRLLNIEGILDVANTSLNDATENLSIEPDNIPIRGDVTNA